MLKIADQGEHHLVVIKPYNMVVVNGRGVPKPTLLDLAHKEISEKIRPVHRLDRVTYGLTVLAKTLYGQQALSDAFRRRIVDKRYLAIIEGIPNSSSLCIDARLQRVDDKKAKKGPLSKQTVNENGQRALTRVKVWAKGSDFSLVEARPETGRMHQIRAHLAHVGHPIVGDKLYGSTTQFDEFSIALCAYAISFPNPSGKRRSVLIEMPHEMKKFCETHGLEFQKKFETEKNQFSKK